MNGIVRACTLAVILCNISVAQTPSTSSQAASTDTATASDKKEVVVRVDSSKPGNVELKKGDVLTFKLPVQPGTGYTWVVKGESGGLKKIGTTVYQQSINEPGAVETQILSLTATEVGKQDISLAYVPVWDRSSPAQTITMHVSVGAN